MKNKVKSVVELTKDMQKKFIDLHLALCNSILITYKGTLFRQELNELSTFGGLLLANACFAPHKKTSNEDWSFYSLDFNTAGEEEEEDFYEEGFDMLASRLPFFRVESDIQDGTFETYFSFNEFCRYENNLLKESIMNIILYSEECSAKLDEAFCNLGKSFDEDSSIPKELFRGIWKDQFLTLLFSFAVEGVGCMVVDVEGLPQDIINQVVEAYNKIDPNLTSEYHSNYGTLSISIDSDVSVYADNHDPVMLDVDDFMVQNSYKFMLNPEDLK